MDLAIANESEVLNITQIDHIVYRVRSGGNQGVIHTCMSSIPLKIHDMLVQKHCPSHSFDNVNFNLESNDCICEPCHRDYTRNKNNRENTIPRWAKLRYQFYNRQVQQTNTAYIAVVACVNVNKYISGGQTIGTEMMTYPHGNNICHYEVLQTMQLAST